MIKATDLKIEYLTGNPTIDIVSPKLLWKVQEAKTQTAYQVKAVWMVRRYMTLEKSDLL